MAALFNNSASRHEIENAILGNLRETGRGQSEIDEAVAKHHRLPLSVGKCVWDLRPVEEWNKGDAFTHLVAYLRLHRRMQFTLGMMLQTKMPFVPQ